MSNEYIVKSVMLAPRRAGKTRMIVNWLKDAPSNKRRIVVTPFKAMVQMILNEAQDPSLSDNVFTIVQASHGALRGMANVEIGFDEFDRSYLEDPDLMEAIYFASHGEGIAFATMTLDDPLVELFGEDDG